MPRVGILAAGEGWHYQALARALSASGCATVRLDPERLVGRAGSPSDLAAAGASAAPVALRDLDAILVRVIPPGSLDQIVFRVDALHLLADGGLPVVNPPRCLERTID